MQKSPLHAQHLELGARSAEFAGWEMPIQYAGIVAEHRAVRDGVGVFDISHMGEFEVTGAGAGAWLDSVFTNDCSVLGDGEGQYTLMLNYAGGVIDDLILYRITAERYFLVVNAAKIEEDWAWLQSRRKDGIELTDRSPEFGALAVQGPDSVEKWRQLAPDRPLPERNGIGVYPDLILCRTGYTGEDGFELFAPVGQIGRWFAALLGADVTPCGLGARDTLRLEKCFPLNGSDLSPERTPLEAGLGFFVKLDKDADFPGKSVLEAQKTAGLPSKLAAIRVVGKAPPLRHGYKIFDPEGERRLGELTSGSLSPTLGEGIGMAYLSPDDAVPGTEISVSIRDRFFSALVVKKPFL